MKKLKEKILMLEKKCAKLQDENESLWQLLDEMKQSDISRFQDQFINYFEKAVKDRMSMTTTKVEEA